MATRIEREGRAIMGKIMSMVSAQLPSESIEWTVSVYRAKIESGLEPGIEQTFLLGAEDGTVTVATVWDSAESLEKMKDSGEEPFARKLLREAGGVPQVSFVRVLAST